MDHQGCCCEDWQVVLVLPIIRERTVVNPEAKAITLQFSTTCKYIPTCTIARGHNINLDCKYVGTINRIGYCLCHHAIVCELGLRYVEDDKLDELLNFLALHGWYETPPDKIMKAVQN